jgi:hypothetical protein
MFEDLGVTRYLGRPPESGDRVVKSVEPVWPR